LIAVSDSDAFFGRFDETAAQGTWRWTPTNGWSLLTGNRTDSSTRALQTDATGDLVGSYNQYIDGGQQGTWRWSPTAGWDRLSVAAPQAVGVSSNGAIFESRGSGGLWRAAPGANFFTEIDSTAQSSAILFALPDGGLYVNRELPGDTHSAGWYWNGGIGFVKIIADTTDINPARVGKDGDLFENDSTASGGTGYWSLQVAYHLLGGSNTQTPTFLAAQR
jgi:hypothetical protein